MKNIALIACPGCARHVRVSDAACPFCKASLAEATRAFTARLPPGQRLSRAALYAFGVGSLTVATACGGTVANGGKGGDDGGFVVDAAYGGSPPDDGSVGQPVYGAPFDASGFPEDAGTRQDVNILPPYGISPPPQDAGTDGLTIQPVYGAPFDASGFEPDAGADAAADVGVAVPYGLPPKEG